LHLHILVFVCVCACNGEGTLTQVREWMEGWSDKGL
jgi:hypothetical protein